MKVETFKQMAFEQKRHLSKYAISTIFSLLKDIESIIDAATPLYNFEVVKPRDGQHVAIYFDNGTEYRAIYHKELNQFEVPSFPLMEKFVNASWWREYDDE